MSEQPGGRVRPAPHRTHGHPRRPLLRCCGVRTLGVLEYRTSAVRSRRKRSRTPVIPSGSSPSTIIEIGVDEMREDPVAEPNLPRVFSVNFRNASSPDQRIGGSAAGATSTSSWTRPLRRLLGRRVGVPCGGASENDLLVAEHRDELELASERDHVSPERLDQAVVQVAAGLEP